MRTYIQIHPTDNVVVALTDLQPGFCVETNTNRVVLREAIPAGHKIALHDLTAGELVVKYGAPIGHAIAAISAGSWVNEKNIKTNLEGLSEYTYAPTACVKQQETSVASPLTFQGYRRKNGQVGIRNELWIVPTVGCVNGIVKQLAEQFRQEYPMLGMDAVVAFPHNYGCSQLGDDHENTRRILRDVVLHPNAGAVLVVGLGCENNQIGAFRELLGDYDRERIAFLETQQVADELEAGMQQLRELYAVASQDKREEIPLSELRVGLKCGGSDGFSGITANPLLGRFSDFLVEQGGTTVLTEVPEMFGAETMLMNRCCSQSVFDKTVHLINDFKSYFLKNDQPIYENPSPGNKTGGISTLEEKSLGCVQKSGTSAVQDVLKYGERLHTKGLNLLSAPGNDLVASTALAASGCHLVLFTTGRGTPFGTFVPTVKVSTNSRLFQHKPRWMDFNAGSLVEEEPMEALCQRFIRSVIEIASGKHTCNETNDFREIAIWKSGVTL